MLATTLFSYKLKAQGSYRSGLLPAINLNRPLSGDRELNFKWESRQLFAQGQQGEAPAYQFRYVLSDFSLLLSQKLGFGAKLAGGYLLRLEDTGPVHRAIQQFTVVRRPGSFRLAHRFAADQTFAAEEQTEFRLRYRIVVELPLNGQSVDAREWYLKIGNEYLGGWQGNSQDLEIRLVPMAGYNVNDSSKLEFGLDYRLGSLFTGSHNHTLWTGITWYKKLKGHKRQQ